MFGGGQQNNNMTFGSWWKDLQIGFKYLLIATIGLGLLSFIMPFIIIIFINIISLTIFKFQIWRLFTSFLVDMSIIQVLMYLYLSYQYIPRLVRSY